MNTQEYELLQDAEFSIELIEQGKGLSEKAITRRYNNALACLERAKECRTGTDDTMYNDLMKRLKAYDKGES